VGGELGEVRQRRKGNQEEEAPEESKSFGKL